MITELLGLPDRFKTILSKLTYKDWQFYLGILDPTHFYLQMRFVDDAMEDNPQPHRGRKWLLSQYMSDSEVIQTAMLAVLTAEEHEARERFRYNGQAIFGPHQNAEDLARYPARLDVRVKPVDD